ncbi:MAG: hypothetical protein WAU36_00315 [Cyclobacteriaceae bacterium]
MQHSTRLAEVSYRFLEVSTHQTEESNKFAPFSNPYVLVSNT